MADTVKADARGAISLFKKLGIRTVMLTGDNRITADSVARAVGIDEVRAGVKPDGKALIVNELKGQATA